MAVGGILLDDSLKMCIVIISEIPAPHVSGIWNAKGHGNHCIRGVDWSIHSSERRAETHSEHKLPLSDSRQEKTRADIGMAWHGGVGHSDPRARERIAISIQRPRHDVVWPPSKPGVSIWSEKIRSKRASDMDEPSPTVLRPSFQPRSTTYP